MSKFRKATLAAGALTVSTLVLAACAPSAGPAGAEGDDSTITVWGWRQEDAKTYDKIFAAFEKEHPGVTVEYVPYLNTEYDTILSTGLKDASGPDVAQLRSYGLLQPLVESGDLVALDDEVSELADSRRRSWTAPAASRTARSTVFPSRSRRCTSSTTRPSSTSSGSRADDLGRDDQRVRRDQGLGRHPARQHGDRHLDAAHRAGDFRRRHLWRHPYLEKMLDGEASFNDTPWVDSVDAWTSTRDYWGDAYQGTSYEDAQALFTSGKGRCIPRRHLGAGELPQANPDLELGIFNAPAPDGSGVPVPGYVDGSFGVSDASDNKEARSSSCSGWRPPTSASVHG